ncbi:MAG: hypothetical protein ABIO31_03075 [Candidatus Nitrotoga sp.]
MRVFWSTIFGRSVMLAQVTSTTFVCIDMPVDRLMADLQFPSRLAACSGMRSTMINLSISARLGITLNSD